MARPNSPKALVFFFLLLGFCQLSTSSLVRVARQDAAVVSSSVDASPGDAFSSEISSEESSAGDAPSGDPSPGDPSPGDPSSADAPSPDPSSSQTVVACQTYSTVANLSTIGANSTYRAAFLRSIPLGTDRAAGILNDAQSRLPPLTIDATLNEQCGNATSIALVEAANNFSNGMVAEFVIREPYGVSPIGAPGYSTIVAVTLCIMVVCGTAVSL